MKLLVACVALVLQGVAPSPQPSPASIEGVVQNINGEPIAGAQVTLTLPFVVGGTRVTIPATSTDRSGSFRFAGLGAGTYRLVAASDGNARREFGQRQAGGPGAPITLKAGEALKDLTIQLIPAGNVNGRVRRSNGRPAPGVTVQLVRRSWNENARLSLTSVATVGSDDRGVFRFYWVTPGRYYVVAGSLGLGVQAFSSSNNNEVVENYPYTFFPGSTDLEKAVVLDVKSGAELEGIDFTLGQSPPLRIRARVIDLQTAKPPVQAIATISYWTPSGGGSGSGGDTYNTQTGIMEFGRLSPGIFDVSVSAYDGPGIPTAAFNRGAPGASAGARVVLSDRDVDLGVLTLEPPSVINGRLTVDGPALVQSVRENLQVNLVYPASLEATAMQPGARPISARLQADGSLSANFPYSAFRIAVRGLPPGFYLREAKLDGADALTSFARVARSSTLEIVVSANGAQVDGVIRDDRARAVSGSVAVIVPDAGRDRPELFKQTISDQQGRYSLAGIPPGDYKLFAWEGLEPYAYFDPLVLRQYEEKGIRIHVAESSREVVELRVISTNEE